MQSQKNDVDTLFLDLKYYIKFRFYEMTLLCRDDNNDMVQI